MKKDAESVALFFLVNAYERCGLMVSLAGWFLDLA